MPPRPPALEITSIFRSPLRKSWIYPWVGGVINKTIAIASARGIVRKRDSRMLAENGGHVLLTKDWAHYLLIRKGYVKRKAKSKAKITVESFEELRYNFLCEIKSIVMMEEISSSIILNWDHTGLKYVPVSSWTMAKQGSKKVSIARIDDKRQNTAIFTINLIANLSPTTHIPGHNICLYSFQAIGM